MFLVHQLSVKTEMNHSLKLWTNLVSLSLEMHEFIPFKQILLNLFDISNAFLN